MKSGFLGVVTKIYTQLFLYPVEHCVEFIEAENANNTFWQI